MKTHLILSLTLMTLLLSACPHGALKTDGPTASRSASTPLLDVIPNEATMAAVVRKEAWRISDDLYALYPGLREKLSSLFAQRLGVDFAQAEGTLFFATDARMEQLCTFMQLPKRPTLAGPVVGEHLGVELRAYPKKEKRGASALMATIDEGVLMGHQACVKAGIARARDKSPRLSEQSPLGELRYADRDKAQLLVGVAKSVFAQNAALKSYAIDGATLSYDGERRLVLRVKGDAEQLGLLEKMLNGLLALQLQGFGERKDKALKELPLESAASMILIHHLALHYGKQLAPVVEDGRLVARLQLPKKDSALVALMVAATAATAIPPFLEFTRAVNVAEGNRRGAAPAGEVAGGADSAVAASVPAGKKVPFEIYIMSKCPYGVGAMGGAGGMLKQLGPRVDFSVDYIVTKMPDGSFKALHGPEEVKGNIVQLCARSLYPKQEKWLPFFECINADWQKIPDDWERCARKTQLDVTRLQPCIDGAQGDTLLARSGARASQANAAGSPTIVIGGKPYSGGRSTNDFVRAVCQQMSAPLPPACGQLPKPVTVTVKVLSDKRCKKCGIEGLESNLRGRFFPQMTVEVLDYNTKAGKRLYRQLRKDNKYLPIWIFGAEVEKAEKFDSIKRWMRKTKDGSYVLRVPASFDPTAEICDNGVDDTKNGKVDCKDPSCKGKLICRKEIKRQLQVFVMSQCPFAARALLAMREVKRLFGRHLRFDVHYIVDKDKGAGSRTHRGFRALHGAPEVKENIRQLCAKKFYQRNDKYLDYLWCRMNDYRSEDWKPCAKNGIRASVIERCAQGKQGARLLARDMKQAKLLSISGSPTWLANNRFKFNGIKAEDIKKEFCKHNPKTPGCEKALSSPPTTGSGQGSCGN